MTDETVEVAQEEPQVEQQEAQQVEVKETPQEPRNDQAENWKQANEVLRLQKQRIQELESRLSQPAPTPQIEEKDELDSMDPDDLITAGKARDMVRKMASKEAQEAAKKIVQEYAQNQTLTNDESRMRSKHDDYDYVVENFALPAIKNDPALAYKIQQSKNPAETAYKLGKLSDDYQEVAMKQETSPKAEKILKNSSRPISSSAATSALKSQADSFSKMSQSEIWAQSQKYAKGA